MNNIKNVLIGKQNLNEIIGSFSHNFISIQTKNITTYQNAFRHKSVSMLDNYNDLEDNFCSFYLDNRIYSYERLEFLGDAVIKLITAEYLYNRYPHESEGFLTETKSRLEKTSALANFSKKLNLDKFLLISCDIERIRGRQNDKLLEDIYEGFIGALYKDQGFEICKEFITSVYERLVDFEELISINDNHKNRLLIDFHSKGWGSPVYKNTSMETDSKNQKKFTSIVILDKASVKDKIEYNIKNKIIKQSKDHYDEINKKEHNLESYKELTYYILSIGIGKTKKESEQDASRITMDKFSTTSK